MRTICSALFVLLCLSACSVNTQNDYMQYLRNNSGAVSFPVVGGDFCYDLTERTWSHRHEVKTWMGGIFNTWVVELGPMLDATMRTGDVQGIFRSLRPLGQKNECRWVSVYDLAYYDFTDTRAKIGLSIRTTTPDGRSLAKEYRAEGPAQRGKMYWGKNFAMKNAIQQSTKHALDIILAAYYADLALLAPR